MTHAGGDNAGGDWFPKSLRRNRMAVMVVEATVSAGAIVCSFMRLYLFDVCCVGLQLLLFVSVDKLVVVSLHHICDICLVVKSLIDRSDLRTHRDSWLRVLFHRLNRRNPAEMLRTLVIGRIDPHSECACLEIGRTPDEEVDDVR